MEHRILNKMCCPFDKADLNLTVFNQNNDTVLEGLLVCTGCRRYYPIISGIPIMSPDEYREPQFELPFLKKWEHELPKGLQNFRVSNLLE